MKKIIISVISLILLVMCSIRIYNINSNSFYVPINTYYKNEEVSLNDNFFGSASESSNGYSISVLDTSEITVNEFKKKYDINENIGIEYADYIGIVHVKIKNLNCEKGEKGGINMQRFILQNNAHISYYAPPAYSYINYFPNTMFSLAQNDEQEFWIPFSLTNDKLNINEFSQGDSYLIVSLYPTKCRIRL